MESAWARMEVVLRRELQFWGCTVSFGASSVGKFKGPVIVLERTTILDFF